MITASLVLGLCFLLSLLTGCEGFSGKINSVQRSAWDSQITAGRSERKLLERELWRVRQENKDLQAELRRAEQDLVSSLDRQRTRMRELAGELAALAAMEEDLVAVRGRRAAI